MNTALEIALAFGTCLSLVLHYLGRKNATAEKMAEVVDEAESLGKALTPAAPKA